MTICASVGMLWPSFVSLASDGLRRRVPPCSFLYMNLHRFRMRFLVRDGQAGSLSIFGRCHCIVLHISGVFFFASLCSS